MASNKINYNDRGKCQSNLLLVSVSNLFPISSRILILFLQKRKKKSILGDYCFSYRDNGFIMLYPIFTILSWTVCQLLHSKIQSVMNYRYGFFLQLDTSLLLAISPEWFDIYSTKYFWCRLHSTSSRTKYCDSLDGKCLVKSFFP